MGKSVSIGLIAEFKERFLKYNPISTRSMFGGYGLCHHNVMFALIFDGILYLRADRTLINDFESLKMGRLIFDKRGLPLKLNYYQITEAQWRDDSFMHIYIMRAISGAIFDKNRKRVERKQRIKDLPNMNSSLERSLWRIGIQTIDQLITVGAAEAYRQLKQQQQSLNIEILYLLAAAIEGCHIAVLSRDVKIQLQQEIESRL